MKMQSLWDLCRWIMLQLNSCVWPFTLLAIFTLIKQDKGKKPCLDIWSRGSYRTVKILTLTRLLKYWFLPCVINILVIMTVDWSNVHPYQCFGLLFIFWLLQRMGRVAERRQIFWSVPRCLHLWTISFVLL